MVIAHRKKESMRTCEKEREERERVRGGGEGGREGCDVRQPLATDASRHKEGGREGGFLLWVGKVRKRKGTNGRTFFHKIT